MSEKKYLLELLKIIVEQLAWGPPESWNQYHYKALSDRIFKKNKEIVHHRTIKRIFELFMGSEYHPHISTKNILAQFLDFEDWDAFRAYSVALEKDPKAKSDRVLPDLVEGEPIPDFKEIEKESKKSRIKFYGLILVIGCILIAALIFWIKTDSVDVQNSIASKHTAFTTISDTTTLPVTLTLHFKEQVVKSDSLESIQKNGFKTKVSNIITDSLLSFTYFEPGVYRFKVAKRKTHSTIYERTILIPGKGWNTLVGLEEDKANPARHTLDVPQRNGLLYLDPERVKTYKEFNPSKVYFVHYRKFGHTGILGDDATFSARVINNEVLKGITCFDHIVILRCQNKEIRLQFVKEGCGRFVILRAPGVNLNGVTSDLNGFTGDIENGIEYKFSTSGKNLVVYLGPKKILDIKYTEDLGEILGIEFLFKGHGAVDRYELKSNSDSTRFESDEFEPLK